MYSLYDNIADFCFMMLLFYSKRLDIPTAIHIFVIFLNYIALQLQASGEININILIIQNSIDVSCHLNLTIVTKL